MTNRSKIGLLGGSFDPIHYGHLQLAQWTFERLELNKILFIPAATPPHKRDVNLTAAVHRLNMVKIALQDFPPFEASDIEIKRKGVSYTIDTIHEIKDLYQLTGDDVHLIIGADNLVTFYSWRAPEQILNDCRVVVFRRAEFDISQVDAELLDSVQILDTPLLPVSSTEIREKIRLGQSVAGLVPEKVLAYIEQHGLYREPNSKK
ncbi:MAG: nicotinate-nucleotide adenylyltransferase [Calditrichaeota bacterium]|nr:nicotinate-nucleotide adenylyltransferase [Calditrichota bacterium]